jgi:hypothetical protein
MVHKINILAVLILLVVLLMGCTTTSPHINQIKDKWGPPAKVEDRGDTIVYYYYFYRGGGRIAVTDSPLATLIMDKTAKAGWYVVEITTDAEGKILRKRKYWKQPEIK